MREKYIYTLFICGAKLYGVDTLLNKYNNSNTITIASYDLILAKFIVFFFKTVVILFIEFNIVYYNILL